MAIRALPLTFAHAGVSVASARVAAPVISAAGVWVSKRAAIRCLLTCRSSLNHVPDDCKRFEG